MLRTYALLTAALLGISSLASPAYAFEGGKGKGKGKGKGVHDNPADILKHRDKNNDGKLSLEEFKANARFPDKAEARFKRFDANNDGFVTMDELKTGFEKAHEKKK